MLIRGDGETDPAARRRHYAQALATAPEEGEARTLARRKHAMLILSMASDALQSQLQPHGMSPTMRQDLLAAAADLEAIGDHEKAAEAYARAGDVDGQARSLARAGDVEKLDAILAAQQGRDRQETARRQAHEELAVLLASGRRREAVALARGADDEGVKERGRSVEAARVSGDAVRVELMGRALTIVLGSEVLVGRVGAVSVMSAAVSRQHVAVARRGDDVVVRDLGSRNGTLLRGLMLTGEAVVGDGIEVRLGREVPLLVKPATELPGTVAIEVGGARYIASLGPARLGVGAWQLERGDDGWVELVTGDDPPAFAGRIQLAQRVTLLSGDAIARERGGVPVLRVGEPCRPS